MKKKTINKSAESGKFVSREEVRQNPDKTFTQKVESKPRRRKFTLAMISGDTIEDFREKAEAVESGFVPVTNVICVELTRLGEKEDGFFQIFGKKRD